MQVLGLWADGDGSVERAWVDATGRRLEERALPGGYPNMLGPDDPRSRDAYGPNRGRLLAVKARHDPDGVFTAIGLT